MKISNKKKEKISEQILFLLYSSAPQLLFTSQIAEEIARDEEFIKKLLLDMKTKKLVIEIKKNPKGVSYLQRSRWSLTDKIYNFYKNQQISADY